MNFNKDTMYRLTELKNCFIIGHADFVVPSKDGKPLLIADPATMIDYLSAYVSERGDGKVLAEAHAAALKYINVGITLTPERVLT